MRNFKTKDIYFIGLCLVFCLSLACNPTTTNTNTATNTSVNSDEAKNANAETNANVATNETNTEASSIESEEPNKYQATVVLRIETKGGNNMAIPKLQANVARDGENRRMEITAPNGEKIIYLTVGDKQFVVAPARKQYAELDKEAIGVDIRKVMTPDQIVNQVKNLKGVKRVGEEKFNDRDVIKYTFDSTTDTQTKAGKVETESYILVDKETNLPVQSVTDTQSQSGEVQGVSGLKVITEINNIKMEVDESLFKEPTDFKKVEAEEVRNQMKAFFDMAQLVVGQLLKTSQNSGN